MTVRGDGGHLAADEMSIPARSQLVSGGGFILNAPDRIPAIFGRGDEVLWAQGEAMFLVGPPGVGKTTVLEQLTLRRGAVLDGDLIGFPVVPDLRATLYLALDRPQQIARSFKRMVTDAHESLLGRLVVWKGPLPFSLAKEPEKFVLFVQEIGETIGMPVGTVCADSLKDMAAPLSSDEVGAAVARAIAGVIAAEIEFAASHHQRKATSENKKPRSLDDVYGSTWITAGAGSVLLLWGQPGDPLVELTHLKQPAEEVGPLELSHDHQHGVTTRQDRLDAWTILQAATAGGVSAADAAVGIYGINPSRAQIEKVRRRFDRFASDGYAVKIDASQPTDPTLYRPVTVSAREGQREQSTPRSRSLTNGSTEPHDPLTVAHDPTVTAPHPLKGGGRDQTVNGYTDDELQALIDSTEETG